MSDRAEAPPSERQGWRGQALDFAQAFGHQALESPINALAQVTNHYTGSRLPRLDIIGAPERDSIGTRAGAVVGIVADLVAISRVAPPVPSWEGCHAPAFLRRLNHAQSLAALP